MIAGKIKEQNEKSGSIQNKAKYALKQYGNFKMYQIKDTFTTVAGIGASAGAAAVVAKSKTAQGLVQKGLDAIKNSNFTQTALRETKKLAKVLAPYANKVDKWVSALPPQAKAVLVAGIGLTEIVSNLNRNKLLIKSGEINKEMEISAKLEKQENDKRKEILG